VRFLAGNAMIDAVDNNADLMVTPCPLCHLKMDTYQDDIGKSYWKRCRASCASYASDGSFSFGCTPKEIGLNYHVQPSEHILEEVK